MSRVPIIVVFINYTCNYTRTDLNQYPALTLMQETLYYILLYFRRPLKGLTFGAVGGGGRKQGIREGGSDQRQIKSFMSQPAGSIITRLAVYCGFVVSSIL